MNRTHKTSILALSLIIFFSTVTWIYLSIHSSKVRKTSLPTEPVPGITLVTQMTLEEFRIQRLKWNIERWKGPVVAAVKVPQGVGYYSPEIQDVVEFIQEKDRDDVNLVVYETHSSGGLYPVNFMRNLAISQAKTEFIFYIDVDFIISSTAYDYLMDHPEELDLVRNHKFALILPAFQFTEQTPYLVHTKEDLRGNQDKIEEFHSNLNLHEKTDYPKWWNSTKPYDIEYKGNIRYEPYFIVERSAPLYDERFMGRGCNKIAQVWELQLRGYQFRVLPSEFIFHLNHGYEKSKRTKKLIRDNCLSLFKKFKREMWKDIRNQQRAQRHEQAMIGKG
eukprot:gb/GECH01004538.1/.p1 GENE.gb/GECH01004538.1/~~gb/GECH01004538.1/.p1  ORF type:complete len:334 (+),score=65.28 gb/GECH01004538.1/:1-1002(+)